MWALRRASNPLKNQGFIFRTSQACVAKAEVANSYLDGNASNSDSNFVIADRCMSLKRFYGVHASPKLLMWHCSFSSQADTKDSAQDDDLEDGFSELEDPASANVFKNKNLDETNEDELISEPELSEEEDDGHDAGEPQDELKLSDSEANVDEKKTPGKRASSRLVKAIIEAPPSSVQSALIKWVEEGNDLTKEVIWSIMLNLRKWRMFGKALQISEWLISTKRVDFVERDYASHLSLISKVHGLHKAEAYIKKIPESFRGEVIYRTLLASCVSASNVKKAEEVFNKMRDLNFPLTSFACNQLLLLYKRNDKKKIADVLLLMEKENLKPSAFTYKVLIDAKGQSNDIVGMDQIVETMKAEGIEPDLSTQALMAKHYVSGGLREKGEAVLKEMEQGNAKENRWACHALLPLYAALGKDEDVGRIWKVCESNPRLQECMAAVEAWGKLKRIEEAEAVFDRMLKTWKKLNSKHYSALLRVYADNKMLAKGKDLVKRMAENGCRICPLTWDALIKLYVEAGEVEKADSVLQKAAQQNQVKPMFSSYVNIMEQYARRGDVHNCEKMFHRMRQVGYTGRLRQYHILVQCYITAKAPAYGIRERMKADNIFPSKSLASQLVLVDAFRRTAVSDLLD
ncbi:pentatricopeptide repeat-containing protein At1g80270, mitochondrial [Diospyros lotus]|uniref:pentatricopeptide repeat-containing protein At1g80270, mitochondrial n=1 Tax=Diospyros lotus TaxID=55363 RepID=UPI0022553B00|nr:pentatricopeptide repeat-containing protein At1g80270, mitochondrial [Diospyros lotus]